MVDRCVQELIAPRHLEFYDKFWTFLGTKNDLRLSIERITRISRSVLAGTENITDVPVACRMSWAARRETTRVEDMAYSLLGIFGINMPMLYGEGQRAFIRLQEEIVKEYADLSIFAWIPLDRALHSGVFAPSPANFDQSVGLTNVADLTRTLRELSVTNQGIRVQQTAKFDPRTGLFHLQLDLVKRDSRPVIIFLRQIGPRNFVREHPYHLVKGFREDGSLESFQIAKTLKPHQVALSAQSVLSIQVSKACGFAFSRAEPMGSFDPTTGLLHAGYTESFLGYIVFSNSHLSTSFTIVLEFFKVWKPRPWILEICGEDEGKRLQNHFPKYCNLGDRRADAEQCWTLSEERSRIRHPAITAKLIQRASYELHIGLQQ